MATFTPVWTDNVSVVAAQVMALGSNPVLGTLDLRNKYGAYLFIKIGRGGTTALTNGIDVFVRRVINTTGGVHPSGRKLTGQYFAASSTTVSSDSNSGQNSLIVLSTTGFVAGDIICIQDFDGGFTRLEWHRVSKSSAGLLTLDRPLQFTHTAVQADTVRNKADVMSPIWLEGGSLYEVIFDYGDDSTGEPVTIQAIAQTYDSDIGV